MAKLGTETEVATIKIALISLLALPDRVVLQTHTKASENEYF